MLPGAPVLLSWPCSAPVTLPQSLMASRKATPFLAGHHFLMQSRPQLAFWAASAI